MIDVPQLVELEVAQSHLSQTPGVSQVDVEIQAKLAQATAFVIRACGTLADATWTVETVPAPVQTAILMHLAELYADRGDEPASPVVFGQRASRYLEASGYRDPVLA